MSNTPETKKPEGLVLTPVWSSVKVRELIEACKTPGGPTTLKLGRLEKQTLVDHLCEAFGDVPFSDQDLYYMGLHVVEVDEDRHLSVAGTRSRVARHRSDKIIDEAGSWRFRTGL